jgi:anti-sigma regulatory factor (Ser/Thr protein kinase)
LRQLEVHLAATTAAAGQARSALRAWLQSHEATADGIDVALIVVSELVTNSVRHAAAADAELHLSARVLDDALRVQVRDGGTRGTVAPRTPQPSGDRIGGFGLQLVAAVALAWGVERDHEGTHVWAQLPL